MMAKDDAKKAVVSRAFSNDEGEIVNKKKVELKLSNKGSMTDALPKKPSKEVFEQKATEANDTLNSYGERGMTLAPKFGQVLRDKTLADNRNPFSKAAEKELLDNLIKLAIDMDNDPHENEGAGSQGILTLLLHSMLFQRDKINELEYKLSLLDKKMREMNALPLTPSSK